MKALADYLERTNTTQLDFARRVGLSQSVISDLIRGIHSPSLHSLQRISKETGLTLDKLVSAKAA